MPTKMRWIVCTILFMVYLSPIPKKRSVRCTSAAAHDLPIGQQDRRKEHDQQRDICRQLERQWRNSVAFTLGTSIVWLFNHSLVQIKHHGGEFMSSVVHLLREHACKAGLSDTFDDFGLVRTYYHEAELALSLGQVRDPHFWYFNFGDYALDYIAYQATRQLGANQVAHKGLLALKAHDAAKGTDYVETLKAYLDNNQNAVRTAEQLFVHRTSLIRRIQRIEKIGNLNLADANEVAYLQISFRILE